MFEHAHRDDAVEPPVHRPVVEQFERHAVRQTLSRGAVACLGQLLGGQRDAGDARAVIARQGQCQAAPAAADIKHRQVRAGQAKLGGEVALLGRLRFLQRLVAAAEIGAGVLPVAIEEQAVQPATEVVVVRHVAERPRRRIVLVDATLQQAQCRSQPSDRQAVGIRREVADQHVEHVVDAARVGRQRAVHVALADRERRVQHQPAHRGAGVDGDAAFRSGPAGVTVQSSVGPAHGQPPDRYEPLEDCVQCCPHRSDPNL